MTDSSKAGAGRETPVASAAGTPDVASSAALPTVSGAASAPAGTADSASRERGIGHWMRQVVAEAEHAKEDFAADPVHDLRVAIRRCRSMAEGFRALDPNPAWKRMRAAAKPLFSALGELRDVQVLMEWTAKLAPESDPVRQRLLTWGEARERELKTSAAEALGSFDLDQWNHWTDALEESAQRLAHERELFALIALEKLDDARRMHATALRNRSSVSWHQLRIAVKRFRYLVENFLPEQHHAWIKDLKHIQDQLGEVHDFDVLWAVANEIHAFATPKERLHWRALLARERERRIAAYREKMVGRDSLWLRWRDGLPHGEALRRAVQRRFELLIEPLGGDPRHARHVLRLSAALLAGLHRSDVLRPKPWDGLTAGELLTAAAVAHGVRCGNSGSARKSGWKWLKELEPPPGWSAEHLHAARLAGRYSRGPLPGDGHKGYQRLGAAGREMVATLAGALRLADGLDQDHKQTIRRLRIVRGPETVTIFAEGYQPLTRPAERIAAARYLLETVCGMPLVVRPAENNGTPAAARKSPARAAQMKRTRPQNKPPRRTTRRS